MLSLGWIKGLRHYRLIALLGWPLPPRGNSGQKFHGLEVLSFQDSLQATPTKVFFSGDITTKILSNGRENPDAPTRARTQQLMSKGVSGALSSRTRLQCFLASPPLSSFKILVISNPQLVHALRTMSLAKAVPKGIKVRECKRFWYILILSPLVPLSPQNIPLSFLFVFVFSVPSSKQISLQQYPADTNCQN